MEQRIEKWNKWLEKIDQDVSFLLSNRSIFRKVQKIVDNNPKIQSPNVFYAFLADTYVAFAAMAVLRQLKFHRDSISFAGLLQEIIETPYVLSRAGYATLGWYLKKPADTRSRNDNIILNVLSAQPTEFICNAFDNNNHLFSCDRPRVPVA